MTVRAITPHYHGEVKDRQENFGGKILVYIYWHKHMSMAWTNTFVFDPKMPLIKIKEEILPMLYQTHPDFAKIDWNAVLWTKNLESFVPDFSKSLAENGFDHKSLLAFKTPGLDGIGGTAG